MKEKVKCIFCTYLGLKSKQQGTCSKDKQDKQVSELRMCKDYQLGPMHSVKWRIEKVNNA